MVTDQDALRVVNSSGFPLQIAVHNAVESAQLPWRFVHKEHAWRNDLDGGYGFIDLVVQHSETRDNVVVECKRVQDSTWYFLDHGGAATARLQCKAWSTYFEGENLKHFGWADFAVQPSTPQAQFCCVRGQSSNSGNTFLERVAGELVSSTEALALEERNYPRPPGGQPRLYFNVIVTTAELQFAEFDAGALSLDSGTLANANFHVVPYLRVRKQFSTHPEPLTAQQLSFRSDPDQFRENTVFVVTARHFGDFLRELAVNEIDFTSFRASLAR